MFPTKDDRLFKTENGKLRPYSDYRITIPSKLINDNCKNLLDCVLLIKIKRDPFFIDKAEKSTYNLYITSVVLKIMMGK